MVWRDERLEDATWESEVALRHASDLVYEYRAKTKAKAMALKSPSGTASKDRSGNLKNEKKNVEFCTFILIINLIIVFE